MDSAFRRAVAEARRQGICIVLTCCPRTVSWRRLVKQDGFDRVGCILPLSRSGVFLAQCLSEDHSCREPELPIGRFPSSPSLGGNRVIQIIVWHPTHDRISSQCDDSEGRRYRRADWRNPSSASSGGLASLSNVRIGHDCFSRSCFAHVRFCPVPAWKPLADLRLPAT